MDMKLPNIAVNISCGHSWWWDKETKGYQHYLNKKYVITMPMDIPYVITMPMDIPGPNAPHIPLLVTVIERELIRKFNWS